MRRQFHPTAVSDAPHRRSRRSSPRLYLQGRWPAEHDRYAGRIWPMQDDLPTEELRRDGVQNEWRTLIPIPMVPATAVLRDGAAAPIVHGHDVDPRNPATVHQLPRSHQL